MVTPVKRVACYVCRRGQWSRLLLRSHLPDCRQSAAAVHASPALTLLCGRGGVDGHARDTRRW
jgi:hypothetical protein